MKKTIFILTLFISILSFSTDKVMDKEGNVYQIFQNNSDGQNNLVLYFYLNNGLKTFITLPSTEDPEKEVYPNLIYSSKLKSLIILYVKEKENYSDLYLEIFDLSSNTSNVYKITESYPSLYCLNPSFSQTYKVFENSDGSKSILHLIHILWWEKGEREGAVYLNIPVLSGELDFEFKTKIYLNDLISPNYNENGEEISPYLYENPQIFIPKTNENNLSIFFADLGSLSYYILDLNYDNGDTLRDRAHFPDIGVRATFPIPITFNLTSPPEFILGTESRIALLHQNEESLEFSQFCNEWLGLTKIGNASSLSEAKVLVKNIIEDPNF